ncbi:hypothetical protein M2146_001983 [Lachnospiraceae bacterium PF1-22]
MMRKRRIVAIILSLLLIAITTGCGKQYNSENHGIKSLYNNAKKNEKKIDDYFERSEKIPLTPESNGFELLEHTVSDPLLGEKWVALDETAVVIELGYEKNTEYEIIEEDLNLPIIELKTTFRIDDRKEGNLKIKVQDSDAVEYIGEYKVPIYDYSDNEMKAHVCLAPDYRLPLYYEISLDDNLILEGIYTGTNDELGVDPERQDQIREKEAEQNEDESSREHEAEIQEATTPAQAIGVLFEQLTTKSKTLCYFRCEGLAEQVEEQEAGDDGATYQISVMIPDLSEIETDEIWKNVAKEITNESYSYQYEQDFIRLYNQELKDMILVDSNYKLREIKVNVTTRKQSGGWTAEMREEDALTLSEATRREIWLTSKRELRDNFGYLERFIKDALPRNLKEFFPYYSFYNAIRVENIVETGDREFTLRVNYHDTETVYNYLLEGFYQSIMNDSEAKDVMVIGSKELTDYMNENGFQYFRDLRSAEHEVARQTTELKIAIDRDLEMTVLAGAEELRKETTDKWTPLVVATLKKINEERE